MKTMLVTGKFGISTPLLDDKRSHGTITFADHETLLKEEFNKRFVSVAGTNSFSPPTIPFTTSGACGWIAKSICNGVSYASTAPNVVVLSGHTALLPRPRRAKAVQISLVSL